MRGGFLLPFIAHHDKLLYVRWFYGAGRRSAMQDSGSLTQRDLTSLLLLMLLSLNPAKDSDGMDDILFLLLMMLLLRDEMQDLP